MFDGSGKEKALYMDMTKAFDHVDHKTFMQKLETCDVPLDLLI